MEKKGRCHLLDDTMAEILDCRRRVTAWDAFWRSGGREDGEVEIEVWAEVRRMREEEQAAVVFNGESISAGEWAPPGKTEMCDTVLQVERMIFRGLVEETIGGLVGRCLLPGKLLV